MENEKNKLLKKIKQHQNTSNNILSNAINISEKTKEELIFKKFEEKINATKFSRIDKDIFTLFFDKIKEELNKNDSLNNINNDNINEIVKFQGFVETNKQ